MHPTPPEYLNDYADLYANNAREAALQWFRDAKYGLFLHYGLYSLLGRHEWVQFKEKIRPGDYAELAHAFKADRFDANAIAELAVEAEMKYVTLTTRHHDGFCLWDTKQSNFKSTTAPCGRDLVAELAHACDKRGLGLCLYYSHGRDWKHPHAPNNDKFGGNARPFYDPPELTYAGGHGHHLELYVRFMEEQVKELLTQYGPIASIWLDGIATPKTPKDHEGNIIEDYDPHEHGDPFRCQDLYDLVHSLQPQVLVSYKQGYLGTEDYFAPEEGWKFDPDQSEKPAEVCGHLTGGWGYTAGTPVRPMEEIWGLLERLRSKRCNLLLNTGPLPDGSIAKEEAQLLRTMGQRLRKEGFPGE